MGTQKTDTQTAQYDPGSKALFGQLTNALGPMLSGYMNNPFGNPFFQTQQQMGTRQAQNLGGMQMGNVARNLTASGLGGGGSTSPFAMEMMQNQGRANTGLQANLGFLNPVQNALGMQQWAGGLGAGYRPLQTGQQQVEKTGGLGTWLPQVAGMALGGLTGGLMGGGLGAGMFGANTAGGGPGGSYGGSMGLPMAGLPTGGYAGGPTFSGLGMGGNDWGAPPSSGGGGGAPNWMFGGGNMP